MFLMIFAMAKTILCYDESSDTNIRFEISKKKKTVEYIPGELSDEEFRVVRGSSLNVLEDLEKIEIQIFNQSKELIETFVLSEEKNLRITLGDTREISCFGE